MSRRPASNEIALDSPRDSGGLFGVGRPKDRSWLVPGNGSGSRLISRAPAPVGPGLSTGADNYLISHIVATYSASFVGSPFVESSFVESSFVPFPRWPNLRPSSVVQIIRESRLG